MLKGKEHSLFESCLSDYLAKNFMLVLHILAFDRANPFDKSCTLKSQGPTPANTRHEVLLSCTMRVKIAPDIEVRSEFELSLTTTHSINHLDRTDFVSVDALTIQVELSPEEEEFLAHLVADISIDYCVPLVVFVNNIECFSVPDAKVKSFPVDNVVAQDSLQLVNLCLEIDHDFCSGCDLLETHFLLFADIFVQNLEQKLCNQCFDMLLVLMLSVDPLNVHLADISLILVTQLIHASNKFVPLIGQIGELVIECQLVLSVLDLVAPAVL